MFFTTILPQREGKRERGAINICVWFVESR